MGAPQPRERDAVPLQSSPLFGASILLVEDHPDSRDMTRQLLESQGAHVQVASDGAEGLNVLSRGLASSDLVLCDIRMPVMDGLTFARRVRSDLRWHRLPIVALTAYGAAPDYLATLTAGFDAHITKPLEADTLLAVAQRLIGSRDTRQKPRRRPRR